MYFINEEHEANYQLLMGLYELKNQEDVQYQASLYIAALPEIFNKLPETIVPEDRSTPLVHFLNWDEEKEEHEVSHPGLTGSTRRLVEYGMSLYNGFPCDMDSLAGSATSHDYPHAIIEAFKIRARIA